MKDITIVLKIAEYKNGKIRGYRVIADPGAIYIIRGITDRYISRDDAIRIIKEIKSRVRWINVISFTVLGRGFEIEFEVGKFVPEQTLPVILSFLPEILGIIGIGLIAATMYIAIINIPGWAVAMGLIGVFLLMPMILSGLLTVSPPKIAYKGKMMSELPRKLQERLKE